jgi:hypothetical protein
MSEDLNGCIELLKGIKEDFKDLREDFKDHKRETTESFKELNDKIADLRVSDATLTERVRKQGGTFWSVKRITALGGAIAAILATVIIGGSSCNVGSKAGNAQAASPTTQQP